MLGQLLQHLPDVLLCLNRPALSPTAKAAARALGVPVVVWSVDHPRRVGLTPVDEGLIDVHLCFDESYLLGSVSERRQLSLGSGIVPLPGCGPDDEKWPERKGPDICFVGTLGERRLGHFRSVLGARDPDRLALLERLAAGDADPAAEYERITGEPFRGPPCAFVDDVRTIQRRLAVLSAPPLSSLKIYGDVEWATHGGPLSTAYAGLPLLYGYDLASEYFHSRVNINVLHDQCRDSTNSRVYDVLAAGGFLLTEHRPCLEREFDVGKHLVTFSTPEEACELAKHYLAHPAEREAIARAGQRHVLDRHRMVDRCRTLLDVVGPLVGASPIVDARSAPEVASPRLHFLCPDVAFHSGGVKALYRQVQILQRHGFHAQIVHETAGFRAPDAADVRVTDIARAGFRAGDVVVIPEGGIAWMESLKAAPVRKIVIALNWRGVFAALPQKTDFRDYGVERVICNSPFVADLVSWSMGLPVHRYTWGLDQTLFFLPEEKQPTVTYIARKCPAIEELKGLLRSRDPKLVAAVAWRPLGDLPTRADYAQAVREASVFVSLSSAEGLPASLLEAMAAGTLVAGYNGVGGQRELVGEGERQNCVLAENGDYVTLARELEPVLQAVIRGDLSGWRDVIANGRATAAPFTVEDEERSVIAMWQAIVASPSTVWSGGDSH